MVNFTIKLVLHFLPAVPFMFSWPYFGLAAILGVGIFYVKSFKLTSQLNDLAAKGFDQTEQYRDLQARRNFWKGMTFLK